MGTPTTPSPHITSPPLHVLELWEKFLVHEDQLTNITEPPEVDSMSTSKVSDSKTSDILTDEQQDETVRLLHTDTTQS